MTQKDTLAKQQKQAAEKKQAQKEAIKKAKYEKAYSQFEQYILTLPGVRGTQRFGDDGFRVYIAGDASDYEVRKIGQDFYDNFVAIRRPDMSESDAESCMIFVYDDTGKNSVLQANGTDSRQAAAQDWAYGRRLKGDNEKGAEMQKPAQYIGVWRGEIIDVNRATNYRGEIVLDMHEVATTYHMPKGTKKGKLTRQFEADGFLVLKEIVGSWSGTLMLYLDVDSNLKCVWRSGSKFSSQATMIRIESASPVLRLADCVGYSQVDMVK